MRNLAKFYCYITSFMNLRSFTDAITLALFTCTFCMVMFLIKVDSCIFFYLWNKTTRRFFPQFCFSCSPKQTKDRPCPTYFLYRNPSSAPWGLRLMSEWTWEWTCSFGSLGHLPPPPFFFKLEADMVLHKTWSVTQTSCGFHCRL